MAMVENGTFCWDELITNDVDSCKKFYTELFGWEARDTDMSGMTYTLFKQGKTMIGGMMKITQEMVDDSRPDLKPYLGQELTVIAWLWARTVASPDPAMKGKHIPLVRSFWLSKKKGKEAYVQPIIDKENGTYEFKVKNGKPTDGFEPDDGTMVTRQGAKCLFIDTPISFAYLREEGKANRMGQKLLAIVCEGTRGRVYLAPNEQHVNVADCGYPDDYPQTDMPVQALSFCAQLYGMDKHYKLFTPRQLTALTTFSDLVAEARKKVLEDAKKADALPDDNHPLNKGGTGPTAYADAITTYLAFAASKCANFWGTICTWATGGFIRGTFARQALPMTWDFAECNPISDSTGNWTSMLDWVCLAMQGVPAECSAYSQQANVTEKSTYNLAPVLQSDATASATYAMNPVISCDPPYYDNIGYADLSDFFYVWLRRSLREVYPNLLRTMLTPKAEELIASPYRHDGSKEKAGKFFEEGLGQAILRWRELGYADIPTTIFYAFKQAETDTRGTASTGWETFLSGVIDAGFTITGTWPMRTEREVRPVGTGTNALASSVILSCVPRDADAPMATRREFLNALKAELPDLHIHAFSPEEIEAVRKSIDEVKQTEVKPPEHPYRCPRCGVDLVRVNYAVSSGVMIDRCRNCGGVWLDKNELEQIQYLAEQWEEKLSEDREKFGDVLAKIREETSEEEETTEGGIMFRAFGRTLLPFLFRYY